nr:MAG TPA: tail protein [Caudoviricetes sp.]
MIPSMYVDGREINLSDFGVQHVIKSYMAPTLSPVTIKTGGMLSPFYVRTDAEPHEIELRMWLQGNNKVDAMQKMLRLTQTMRHCEMVFPGEPGLHYICTLQFAQTEFSTPRRAILTLDLDCDILSNLQTVTITQNPQTITVSGAQKANINVEVTAVNALSGYQVNDLRITCAKGDIVYIDSENGLADLTKVDMIQFPQALGDYAVSVSNLTDATVKISYRARW